MLIKVKEIKIKLKIYAMNYKNMFLIDLISTN